LPTDKTEAGAKPRTPKERTVATLKTARALVAERWFKGAYFGWKHGRARCCALGAIGLATVSVEESPKALEALLKKMDAAAYADAAAAADAYAAYAAAAAAAYADAAYAAYADAAAAADAAGNPVHYRKRADGYRVGPILRECAGEPIPSWNDAPERTKADVLAAFDCAIAKAEAQKGA